MATLPIEALKCLLRRSARGRAQCIMHTWAYLDADATCEVHARLPFEDQEAHAGDMCGNLVKPMLRHM